MADQFQRQDEAARLISEASPISEYDARGLVFCLTEAISGGATFDQLVDAVCDNVPAAGNTPYCANRKSAQARQ